MRGALLAAGRALAALGRALLLLAGDVVVGACALAWGAARAGAAAARWGAPRIRRVSAGVAEVARREVPRAAGAAVSWARLTAPVVGAAIWTVSRGAARTAYAGGLLALSAAVGAAAFLGPVLRRAGAGAWRGARRSGAAAGRGLAAGGRAAGRAAGASARGIAWGASSLASRRWLLAGAAAAAAVAVAWVAWLDEVPRFESMPVAQTSRVYAADGRQIATLHGEENRTSIPLASISPHLRAAILATEDREFYAHPGVSVRGVTRALWANLRGRAIRQGGSTITQQYVRNAVPTLGRDRTLLRKVREAVLALKVERRYPKDRILEMYLNTVYFGRGAYGAEAAARTYFGKAAAELTLGEAAYLAGVLRAPHRLQSGGTPEKRDAVRDEVLGDLVAAGFAGRAEVEAARHELLAFQPGGQGWQPNAGYFVEYVRRLLKREFGLSDRDILAGGLEIHTTLDLRLQEAAVAALGSTLDRPTDPEGALVAMDASGRVVAMVGGRDASAERARGFNFAYQRSGQTGGRQAGSAFKPFTLAAFLEQGWSVESAFSGPASIEISLRECRGSDGRPWSVENYGRKGYGTMTASEATALSVNTVYAQMVERVKPAAVADLARRAGGFEAVEPVCSLALGTSPVTPLEMARGFATFAARGRRPQVAAVAKIVAPGGRVVAERMPAQEQVLDPNVADTVNHVLQDVLRSGTARGRGIGRPAAGKTGTTQNHVDAWFVGYTPQVVAAVWVGYPPDTETGKIPTMTSVRGRAVTGGFLPATIWQRFMTEAVKGTEPAVFTRPRLEGRILSPPPACPRLEFPFPIQLVPASEGCEVRVGGSGDRDAPGRGRGKGRD